MTVLHSAWITGKPEAIDAPIPTSADYSLRIVHGSFLDRPSVLSRKAGRHLTGEDS